MRTSTGVAWAIVFTVLQILTSCNIKRPCEEPTEFPVKTGFYFRPDSQIIDTTLTGLSVYAIGREDSLLYDRDSTNAILLPLNPFADTTHFILWFGAKSDTISFAYSRSLKMASPECGFAMYFYVEDSYHTHTFIDSISLTDPDLDATKKEHLQIFVY